jgi:hypothetical protein
MHVHAVFPVCVIQGLGGTGEEELAGYEGVVGDRVRSEVGEVSVPDCSHGLGIGGGEDLLSDLPVVAVPTFGYVLLGEVDICRNGPVQEVERESLE